MDTAQGLDPESPEVIREQIEETRASLGHKLETLESEVRSSVQEASDTVKETVNNVKRVFDIRYQVRSRPWLAVSAAFGVGLALGTMAYNQPSGGQPGADRRFRREGVKSSRGERRARALGASSIGWIRNQVQPEIDSAKALALGAAVSFIGDLVKEALPQGLRSRIEPLVVSASRKLGGRRGQGASSMTRDVDELRYRSAVSGGRKGYPSEEYGAEGDVTSERDDLSHDRPGFSM